MTSELDASGLLNSPELKELIKFRQVMPRSMMDAIQIKAHAHSASLEIEVVSRLMATMFYPALFGLESLHTQLLNQKRSTKESFQECKDKRAGWVYIYEIEKLRLFLTFKDRLPRNFKENFTRISVKVESKRILDEIKNQKNPGNADD